MRRQKSGGRPRCARLMRAPPTPRIAPADGHARRHRRRVDRAARPARERRAGAPTSSSKCATTAARCCASATARARAHPQGAHTLRRRPIASATAPPGNVGARPIAHVVLTPALAIEASPTRCRPSAAWKPRTSRRRGATRRRPSARRSAPSPRPTTPRRANGAPTCSAPPRPSAGPAAGTRCSSPPTASAARRSTPVRSAAARVTSSASAWRATTSKSTRRATCRSTSTLHVCVKPDYFRSDVLRAVQRRACRATCCPTAGSACSIPTTSRSASRCISSRIVAAAQAVEGVDAVRLDRFQRLVDPSPASLENGVIPIGRLRSRSSPTIRTSASAAGSPSRAGGGK